MPEVKRYSSAMAKNRKCQRMNISPALQTLHSGVQAELKTPIYSGQMGVNLSDILRIHII